MTISTEGLTARQAQVLLFIAGRIDATGLSPSVGEIAARIGYRNKSGTHAILCRLRERGRITWTHHCANSIRITPPAAAALPPHAYELPDALRVALNRFCMANGENAADVIADAVALHLDAMGAAAP